MGYQDIRNENRINNSVVVSVLQLSDYVRVYAVYDKLKEKSVEYLSETLNS